MTTSPDIAATRTRRGWRWRSSLAGAGDAPAGEEVPPPWAQLRAQLREDLAVHKGDRHVPGFRALAVYRLGAWARAQPLGWQRLVLLRIQRRLARHIRDRHHIELPATAVIGRRLRIPHSGPVVLHPYSRIGDDCTLRHSTTLGTNGPWRRDSAPTLGDRVKLGVGACVLGPVIVGDDAMVGPSAVVFFDVPVGATVVVARPRVIMRSDTESAGAAADGPGKPVPHDQQDGGR